MRVLLFGGTGMLGHIVKIVLEEAGHIVFSPSRELYDITMGKAVLKTLVCSFIPDYIVNSTGILIKDSENNPDMAQLINTDFPRWIEEIMGASRIIHASTDCVFSGNLLAPATYNETDNKDATSVYGKTKAAGEIAGTIRTSIIGPELKKGTGLFHWFVNCKEYTKGYTDHYWNGITALEWAKQALKIIEKNEPFDLIQIGLATPLTKDVLLYYISDVFYLDIYIVPHIAGECNRALQSAIEVPSIEEQLTELRDFMLKHIDIYGQYKGVLGV